MEKEQPEKRKGVQITKSVFDGLEFIRSSGATNMLDRPMVLHLAREWDFIETADWIESVDTRTYGQLIFQGPDIIDDAPIEEVLETYAVDETNEIDLTDVALNRVRGEMHDLLSNLGKQANLTIADTYAIEEMGVLFDPSRRDAIYAERDALLRSLGQASSLWLQLEQAMIEVQRGVGSLQYMIDPETN